MTDEKYVADSFRQLLANGLGLDLTDPNLKDTPERVAKMLCRELLLNIDGEFDGYTCFPNEDKYSQIVMIDNIHFVSMCSHHFLPFEGKAWILYIPNKLLPGASKAARVVEFYAQRPQLQERLCHQILNNFVDKVKPLGCMVYLRAIHQCMRCRGVKQYSGAGMSTSAINGVFDREAVAREEALDMIKMSMMSVLE
jgi:GTP cyclohydrolase I